MLLLIIKYYTRPITNNILFSFGMQLVFYEGGEVILKKSVLFVHFLYYKRFNLHNSQPLDFCLTMKKLLSFEGIKDLSLQLQGAPCRKISLAITTNHLKVLIIKFSWPWTKILILLKYNSIRRIISVLQVMIYTAS